jgi:hypothetical protein
MSASTVKCKCKHGLHRKGEPTTCKSCKPTLWDSTHRTPEKCSLCGGTKFRKNKATGAHECTHCGQLHQNRVLLTPCMSELDSFASTGVKQAKLKYNEGNKEVLSARPKIQNVTGA